MEKDNTTRVLTRFIKELGIPVTRQSISDELQKHPEPNSFLALSDLLNEWNVANGAYPFTVEELIKSEVPTPFIAHMLNGEFVVVSVLTEQQVIISSSKNNKQELRIEEFKERYSGSILIAEKDKASGEINYNEKRRKEIVASLRIPFVISSAIILLVIGLTLHSSYLALCNIQVALLTLFKSVGLIATVLLLVQSIDTNNALIQKLCGSKSGVGCNTILSSKAAKVTTWLSWSEVGFFYFAGTLLVLLFNSTNATLIQILVLLNVVSIPYTFYSVYHQWQVAKQWCIFCCTVQAVLWLEFFASVPYYSFQNVQLPTLATWANFVICMGIPVLIWVFIKPYLLRSQQVEPLKHQLSEFKYNAELFKKILDEQPAYNLLTEENSLIFGNREAETIITIVSNPYCHPCATVHKMLDEWMTKHGTLKLQVVFSTENDENDHKKKVAGHLLKLGSAQNDPSLKKAINDWHDHKYKDFELWANEYPVMNEINVDTVLNAHKEWCEMTEITSTPTIFINGRRLPGLYRPADIKYFVM